MVAKYAVGIDLGTTNSVVSVYRRGVAETIKIEGKSTLPSVVSFRNGETLVGHQAKARLLADPENSIGSVKRHMGDSKKRFTAQGTEYSPVEISSLILKKLVEGASRSLGAKIDDAVITVPAYFDEDQKLATRKAGERIGLNVLRLIPEPTAASVAYGLDQGKDQTILVYDLGGGTFDVSILRVEGNSFRVVAVDGDVSLGGDDFDQVLVQYLAALFKTQTGIDLNESAKRLFGLIRTGIPKESLLALQQLKETAETAKKTLSETTTADVMIPNLMGHPFEAEISRDEYIRMTEHLLERTLTKVRDSFRDARLTAEDIDRVILVGGATRHPQVRELLRAEIKDPYTSERVDEIVSGGAAIMAASLFHPAEDVDVAPIEVTNVTGHSLGVNMLDDDHSLFFKKIIEKNSSYPCKFGILGSTVEAYQNAVVMKVFRGENRDPAKNAYLGELVLPISKPSNTHVPVAAVFELDSDGILHFTAIEIAFNDQAFPFLNQVTNDGGIVKDFETLGKLVQRGFAKQVKKQLKGAT